MARLATCWAVAMFATAAEAAKVDYLKQVKPLLSTSCYACHGALKQEGNLRLDTIDAIRKGGDNGEAIIVGKSEVSLLISRVSSAAVSERMPPEGEGEPLESEQIDILRAWIDQGADGPKDEQPEPDPRDHWSFRAPKKSPLPEVKNSAWARNPIDRFIAAEHESRKLDPQPGAEKSLLLRRVYLDLIGLPPTQPQLQAFLDDSSPDAYERVVDKLLESHQYGERWGRHWMDIWRFSDWWGLGAEVRNSQKHIWHWRDWIIESLNADLGYDEMVRQMLAADELYPTDPSRLRATGFLARQYFKFNRTTWLDETIEHTSKAFMGLTFNCCKCHDHKYDPVSQQDYYRLRAIFEPYQVRLDQVPGQVDYEKDALPRVFDCNLDKATYLHARGDEKRPVTEKPIEPGLPAFLSFVDYRPAVVDLPVEAHSPQFKSHIVDDHLQDAETKQAAAQQALETAKQALAKSDKPELVSQLQAAVRVAEKSLAAADLFPAVVKARGAASRAELDGSSKDQTQPLFQSAAKAEAQWSVAKADEAVAQAELDLLKATSDKKADAEKKVTAATANLDKVRKTLDSPGEKFTRLRGSLKTLESNLESEDSRSKPYPRTSTGRRTALAQWLTDPRNPLTARVAVNHLWSRHFGRPLVPTVFDFGRKGTAPTHPALLDYLAADFMEHGWNMKRLHRTMVTSNTYRLSASARGASAGTLATDAENRYYWRRNAIRMEAQVVRDSFLQLAGELDVAVGGPSVAASDESTRRRSMYFFHSHNEHNKFLSIFDDAGVQECYRRAESIVPQQALALANSKLTLSMAEKIATSIHRSLPRDSDEQAFVTTAWRLILGGAPTTDELATCSAAMSQWRALAKPTKQPPVSRETCPREAVNLVQALLNHNDFVTVR